MEGYCKPMIFGVEQRRLLQLVAGTALKVTFSEVWRVLFTGPLFFPRYSPPELCIQTAISFPKNCINAHASIAAISGFSLRLNLQKSQWCRMSNGTLIAEVVLTDWAYLHLPRLWHLHGQLSQVVGRKCEICIFTTMHRIAMQRSPKCSSGMQQSKKRSSHLCSPFSTKLLNIA